MPELPEVETIRIGLDKLLPGKKVISEIHDWDKGFPNSKYDVQQFLTGAKILCVRRRAKVLLIELDTKYSLAIHLKMTGQLIFISKTKERWGGGHPSDSLVGHMPDKSTRVTLLFSDGSKLFFNDQRKFGWMRLLPSAEVPNLDFFKKVGPEPLAANFFAKEFRGRIRRRPSSTIKSALLDQSVIAGIGNIYADESLWEARIPPSERVNNISEAKLNTLFKSIQSILRLAIDKGGSTDRNYVNARGQRGSYLEFAKVFRREGQPCFRHPKENIIKLRVAGRGTHICPKCQKLRSTAENKAIRV